MTVYVKCKKENCNSSILISDTYINKVQTTQYEDNRNLRKKNYYLCQECGNVNVYSKEDHIMS